MDFTSLVLFAAEAGREVEVDESMMGWGKNSAASMHHFQLLMAS